MTKQIWPFNQTFQLCYFCWNRDCKSCVTGGWWRTTLEVDANPVRPFKGSADTVFPVGSLSLSIPWCLSLSLWLSHLIRLDWTCCQPLTWNDSLNLLSQRTLLTFFMLLLSIFVTIILVNHNLEHSKIRLNHMFGQIIAIVL